MFVLLLLACAGLLVRSFAQTTDSKRKLKEEIRAKAEKGDAEAQYQLGSLYYDGTAIAKNASEAVRWFQKSAGQGHSKAQSKLGECYAFGEGVTKSAVEAVKWWRKAAERDDGSAQFYLGIRCARGEGTPKDFVEAHKWLNLAVAKGDEEARKYLSVNLEPLMTAEQIAEAQRLAREFKPRAVPAPDSIWSPDGILASRPYGSGTGFFITEDGFLVTNYHVIKEAVQVRLITSGGLLPARVVKTDEANDLALVKADGRFVPLPIVSSRTVKMGSIVATVGFPNIGLQGFAPKLAKGDIAALTGIQDDPRYFQISVPLQPGNSGGALVDERGNVVGVVSAKLSAKAALVTTGVLPENVNYAVKSSLLLSFLESTPEASANLKEFKNRECKFDEVVKCAREAAVLVLVY